MAQIILSNDEEKKEVYRNPNSPAEQEEVFAILEEINEMYNTQNRGWSEFNDRTLKQYVDDNQKRINNYVEPRGENIDDWQTRGFEGITREKMFAFVSKVAMSRPKYKFKATDKKGFIDGIVSEVVENIYDYTWNIEDPTSVQFFFDAWQAAGSGIVIRWEGVDQTREMLEEFESYDVTTGEITGLTTKEVVSDINCKSRRVRPLEFLIANWYEPDIQLQPYIAEIFDMSRYDFERQYGYYKNADKVPELETISDIYNTSFTAEQWSSVTADRVRVIHYYEKGLKGSKFRIIANGILILATPIPRKDGKYPYSRGIFKPHADERFFWGKALPDEIASDQDVYNAFKNMVIDRALLYIQRPLIGSNLGEVENEIFRPNGIINIKGGELKTMDYTPPGAADMNILEYLKASINRQTSDAQQSGQAGTGVTAREIVIADENARKLAGVFRLFLEDFDLRATKLRVGNILQFFFEPTKLQDLLGDEKTEELQMAYRTFALDNRTLSDKRNGTKIINIVGKREELPTKEQMDVEEMVAKKQGIEMEKMVVNAQYVKNFGIDMTIVPESSYEQSRSLKLAMENEYQMTVAKLYPQKLQEYGDIFFKSLNEVYDKDMSEFERATKPPVPQLPAGQPQPTGAPGPSVGQQLQPSAVNSLAKMVGASV